MCYWSMSWDFIYRSTVLRAGNIEANFIFQIYSKSREEKCQHKWRNLMSIDWVSLHFVEWSVSVLLINSFIHLVVCLTTGPKPLPKRAVHILRSRASSFKWEYPLLSLRSFNSFLRLLPCLPLTSIPPCIFPSVTRCRRQFRRKIWPIQFAFRLRISCRIFLCSLTLSNTSSFLTWSVQLIFSNE